MATLIDRIMFRAVSSGTGSFVVSSAITGYMTPATGGAVNATVYSYAAESDDKSEWEIGTGTYTSGTTTLTRTPSKSSNSDSLVSFTAAPKVALTALAADIQPASANLTEWSGINPSANGGSLVAAADYAAMRALLDLEAGTDFLSPSAIAAKIRNWEDVASEPDWAGGLSFPSASLLNGGGGSIATDEANARDVTAIGKTALNAATTGSSLVAIGENTMSQEQPGSHNVAIGNSALTYVDGSGGGTEGSRNVALGSLAGHFITTGSYNVLVGRNAGHALTVGTNNVGIGYRSMGAGDNPISFDGTITQMFALGASDQTAAGFDALRYSAGQFNSGFGKSALANIKNGARNIAFGAGALGVLGQFISYDDNVITDVNISGTYSQSGTTVTVSATAVNAVVGRKVRMSFSTGAIASVVSEAQVVTVVSAADANTFTFTSPVSQTASGDCAIDWVETATPASTTSQRNTAIGHNAGGALLTGDFNVLIGNESGGNATFAGGTSYSSKLVIGGRADVRPIIAGDFTNGYLTINGVNADLAYSFRVMSGAGSELFRVGESGGLNRFVHVNAGAGAGPVLILDRDSSSPATSDVGGSIRYYGRDSGGNETNYADNYLTIIDATDGSEDATLNYRVVIAGSLASRMIIGGGVYHTSATGGDKGNNTINYGAVYDDNSLLTCYPIEAANNGRIDVEFWDQVSAFGAHQAARRFADERMKFLDVDAFIAHWRANGHLPTLPSRDEWKNHADDKKSLGEMVQQLWETVDVMAVHMAQIRDEQKER